LTGGSNRSDPQVNSQEQCWMVKWAVYFLASYLPECRVVRYPGACLNSRLTLTKKHSLSTAVMDLMERRQLSLAVKRQRRGRRKRLSIHCDSPNGQSHCSASEELAALPSLVKLKSTTTVRKICSFIHNTGCTLFALLSTASEVRVHLAAKQVRRLVLLT
jgi:hypothetical protein